MSAPTDTAHDGLSVAVRARVGTVRLDVELHVAAGERVAIVGPNGAGKTTLLRAAAGLHPLESGTVHLDGRVLDDVDAGVQVPPADRGLGVLFQDLRLFPHMSVSANLSFGRAGVGPDVTRMLQQLELEALADRRPDQLSGGERQRAALGRAVLAARRGLLLDEPLSAQDARSRAIVRRGLAAELQALGVPVLMVSHEPLEALPLTDRLVVLDAGRVVQVGTPGEVARHPRSEWVARLVGTNLLRGTASARTLQVPGGAELTFSGPELHGPAFATVHPRAVALHLQRPEGSARNVWRGQVTELEIAGDRVRVVVGGGAPLVVEITAGALAEMGLVEGTPVWASFKATEVQVYAT